MKNSLVTLFGLLFILGLCSSNTTDKTLSISNEQFLLCGPPSEFYLVKVGSGRPLYAGVDLLQANTQYKAHIVGGQNYSWACVTSGSNYTYSGSGCSDVGYDQDVILTTITTGSNVSSGVTINVGATCTSGQGNWTGSYSY